MIVRRLRVHLRVLREIFVKRKILINYQMGKVGSSSVAGYFRDHGLLEWHIHRFYDTPVHRYGKKNRYLRLLDLALLNFAKFYCVEIKIISGVRDPLDRDISMFFHNLKTYYPNIEVTSENIRNIEITFKNNFPIGKCVNWYFDEFQRALGIDIFKYSFNKELGFTSFEQGKYKVFIYDMDKLNSLGSNLSIFFDIKMYKLIERNTASNKEYNNVYKEFRKNLQLDKDTNAEYTKSTFYKHFFQ